MQDCIGNELQAGDMVVFVSSPGGRRHLVLATIEEVKGKKITFTDITCQHPGKVLKIPSKEYLEQLEQDSHKLSCLEAAGVDNWSGYDYAMEMMNEEEEPEDE